MKALAILLVSLVGAAASAAATADSPTLVANRQIGDVRMGESEARVTYDYGSDCIRGCPGQKDGCVLGLVRCVGPVYRYHVDGGYLRVGYRLLDRRRPWLGGRVVYLETNSATYRTAHNVGVGTKIPFGPSWGIYRWEACGPGENEWTAGSSWRKPLWKWGKSRWWTRLYVDRGVVKFILMWRGDVNLQGC